MSQAILRNTILVGLLTCWASIAVAQAPAPTTPPAEPAAPAAEPAAPAAEPSTPAAEPAAPAAVPAEPVAPATPPPVEPGPTPTPAPAPAEANVSQSMDAPKGTYEAPSFVVTPHIGILLPQVFSNLGASPVFGLEVGYILPFDVGSMERPLQIHLDAGYSMSGASGDGVSDALGENGSGYDWELTEQILTLDLGFLWRFMRPGDGLSAFGEFAPRMYFTNSVMTASGNGDDFGENSETDMFFGFAVAGGVEYFLGLGSFYGALEIGWSDLNKTITGDTNNGALLIDLGYRFMF